MIGFTVYNTELDSMSGSCSQTRTLQGEFKRGPGI
jgi:hypothetical protein